MSELGIARDGGSVCFGQLLGMCDHVSLTLGKYHHSSLTAVAVMGKIISDGALG